MKSYEVWSSRRKALRLKKVDLAELAECSVEDISNFESGIAVPSRIYENIKNTIWRLQRKQDPIDHYKTRILELAIQIRDEENKEHLLDEMAHIMIELGKLQGEIMGFDSSFYKRK